MKVGKAKQGITNPDVYLDEIMAQEYQEFEKSLDNQFNKDVLRKDPGIVKQEMQRLRLRPCLNLSVRQRRMKVGGRRSFGETTIEWCRRHFAELEFTSTSSR